VKCAIGGLRAPQFGRFDVRKRAFWSGARHRDRLPLCLRDNQHLPIIAFGTPDRTGRRASRDGDMRLIVIILLLIGAVFVTGSCVPNQIIRSDVGVCKFGQSDCSRSSIESHPVPKHEEVSYLLGFAEFDDQGKLYAPEQVTKLFELISEESKKQDLCIIVFVHGWKHNAATDDTNVNQFRTLLGEIGQAELERPGRMIWHGKPWKPRKVVGIYAAWRGLTLNATPIDQNLTFWTRKAAAHRVATCSIGELLARVRAFRDAINRTSWSGRRVEEGEPQPSDIRSTRMLTIGHSFGGLIVFSALSQFLVDGAATSAVNADFDKGRPGIRPATDHEKEIPSYGDLVVVINPAIEAMRYEAVRHLVENRPRDEYARWQNPVFVEVTSVGDRAWKGDWATGVIFPIGRWFNTLFESFTDSGGESEREESLTALGHYPFFWTHELTGTGVLQKPSLDTNQECNDFQTFTSEWRKDGLLRPGWNRRYINGTVLSHLTRSSAEPDKPSPFDPNNPYWIVRADPSVIKDHNDIVDPVFVNFVRQLYDDLVLLKEFKMGDGRLSCASPASATGGRKSHRPKETLKNRAVLGGRFG
jgi:hypothetical protein